MVFQHYSLFPNMTVEENIAFGLKMQKKSKEEIKAKVDSAIQIVELEGKGKGLSGKSFRRDSSREWRLREVSCSSQRFCFWMSR